EKLRRERKPVPRSVEIIDLRTGAKSTVADAQSFTFSKNSRYIAIEKPRASSDAQHTGRDLIVRTLATGAARNIGNVGAYAFNEPGTRLAYTVDAAGKTGNGLYLLDLESGASRVLDSDTLRYDDVTWNEDGRAVAVLRGETPAKMEQRANVLLTFRLGDASMNDGDADAVVADTYDPAADAAFPDGFVLSELGSLSWSEDGSRIFVGIKEQRE